MSEVTCIGIVVADLTAGPLTEYPEKGKLVLTEHMHLDTGGCAANTGLVLSKLGISTSLVAKVGKDDLGDYVKRTLAKNGVDTTGICQDDQQNTGCSMVLNSTDGERSFISNLGANKTLRAEDINWDLLKKSKVLHLGGALLLPGLDGKPTAEVFKKAKQYGITTCLDTVWDSSGLWWDGISECLPYTDLFLPSLVEAEELTGKKDIREIADTFLTAGVKVVGLKMGKKGSCVFTRDKEIQVPLFDVKTVDTNGSGDAYVGGFIAGWINGLSIEKTAYFANAVGAMATMGVGPVGGIKKLQEVFDFIRIDPY